MPTLTPPSPTSSTPASSAPNSSAPTTVAWPDSHQLAADLTEVILPLGVALSTETDCDRLQELVLREAKKLCCADAGCFYLRHGDELQLAAIHNDSLEIETKGETSHVLQIDPISLSIDGETTSSLVARSANAAETLHIADVRGLADTEVRVIREIGRAHV